MSDFVDPLNDPRFPDRPTHPDFWRLSEIVMRHDAMATEDGADVDTVLAEFGIDRDSVSYMMMQRAQMATKLLGLPPHLAAALGAVWVDAFLAGVEFEQKRTQ